MKARTVITTDGEVDDMNSVIRCLLYSNEMDIAGIILTSSMYHYAGDPKKDIAPFRWTGTDWLDDLLDRYGQVYPYLCLHDADYPHPDYLKKVTKIGNVSYVGEMKEETEGSTFLETLFLDEDPRTLYVQTWGGTNTTARALKSIEEKYGQTKEWSDIQKKIYQKLVIYIILDQDDSYASYIATVWPELTIINDRFNFWHFAYAWKSHCPEVNQRLSAAWFKENIKTGHGPLLERYALIGDGQYIAGELEEEQRGIDLYLEKHPEYERYDFISEGDSPSFLYLVDVGLRSLEDPEYGGWGGRFVREKNHLYLNHAYDYNPYTKQYEAEYSLERWFDDFQNDFAARADWCVADRYEKANHAPHLEILEGNDIFVEPGQILTLHANGSDPDGDQLSYHWWRYAEADTYSLPDPKHINIHRIGDMILSQTYAGHRDDRVLIEQTESDTVIIHIPSDLQSQETIHIIAEVADDGIPSLKRYQRIILRAK